jgi:hypothetical protein
MRVLSHLNDNLNSAEEIKKMTDDERQILVKYTKPKKCARANWKAFCVFNFLKLKPKLVDAIQSLNEDPNNRINDVEGVIDEWKVKEYVNAKEKFNDDKGVVSPFFRRSHKMIMFEYAAEIRAIYGKHNRVYNDMKKFSEFTTWGVPIEEDNEAEEEEEENLLK